MKLNNWILASAAICGSAAAFSVVVPHVARPTTPLTRQNMFGGAGAGMPSEDNPEELKAMEATAKQMGMSLEEYKLGISARLRLQEQLDAARVSGGSPDKVAVERDGNNPPKYIEITITDDGKALGKETLSKELVKALKASGDASRKARVDAQKGMMGFISEEMKKLK